MTHALEELRKFVAPEILFGNGARELCGAYAERIGMRRVLVVTDPGVVAAGWVAPVLDDLSAHGIETLVFSDIAPNPRSAQVMNGALAYSRGECDAIVAVGGGSPMDCAKGIGVVASNGGHVLDYAGVDRVEVPMPPLICIPTTAGTGADVSQFAIITDEAHRAKAGLISKSLVPDLALVDPDMLTTMDATLTAATGMDALVHAVEAFVSNASWEMTDNLALAAIRRIPQALPACCSDPDDKASRRAMALASLDAGLAFSNASLGAVHALAHALGGRLDAAHGECNAVLLGPVMARNFKHVPKERLALLAEALGIRDGEETERIPAWFNEFRSSVGIVAGSGKTDLSDDEFIRIARTASVDACMATNPFRPGVDELVEILHDALD
ncbi:MAG: alcohol dehydrogenase [Actinobacteria bacterium HGW-Actinobacteria-1]|jgi:alcohol dehydrogenase class IV|nr:MAG: alcohol dehydrogenase [Actinobacteria bacterium HGW-Actinobacteria-1]